MHEFLNLNFLGLLFITAYGLAVILGNVVQYHIMNELNEEKFPLPDNTFTTNKENVKKFARIQSMFLGMLERVLYITVLQFSMYQIIGFWLVLKLASGWKKWDEDNGRLNFNNFLIGNISNLLISICAYISFKVYHNFHNPVIGFITGLSIIIFPYILILIWYALYIPQLAPRPKKYPLIEN